MSGWMETLQEELKRRDLREKKMDEWISSFQVAAKRAVRAEGAKPRKSPGVDDDNGDDHDDDDDDDEITKLYSELSIKEDLLAKNKNDLKELAKKYTKVKQQAESYKSSTTSNETELAKLRRDKQSLEDEVLALQIQLNVSEHKNKELQEEHTKLVNRWLSKVEGEAEKLNDANAFIENAKRMKAGMETSSTDHEVNYQSDNNDE